MSDLLNVVEFECNVDKKSLEELGKFLAMHAVVIKDQKLWSQKKETHSIGRAMVANRIRD